MEFCSVWWSITWMVAGLSQSELSERFAVTTSVSSLLILFGVADDEEADAALATNSDSAESAKDPRVMECNIGNPINEYENNNYYQLHLHMKKNTSSIEGINKIHL